MTLEFINTQVHSLIDKFGTRDPFLLAEAMGIEVSFRDIGSLKGMYTVILSNRFILLNESLSQLERQMVCAHEIGHDVLHRAYEEDTAFRELSVTDMSQKPEYEASAFAAQLLIEDEKVLELAKQGMPLGDIAAELGTDPNLLLIKIQLLNREGHQLHLPDIPRGDFLKGEQNG